MCGRIVREREDYASYFGFLELSETRLGPRYNIAPTQLDAFVRGEAEGRRLVASRWGLIPVWAKDRASGSKMFNARAETLPERPAFRTLIARHRCIIPASGFYEWRAEPGGKGKTPLYIHRRDGAPLALAGLWTVWQDRERDEAVTSHTVITCAPNEFMSAIHNRMPAILEGDALAHWLDPSETDAAAALALLGPCPEKTLTAHPVAPLVNNVRADGPELIAPLAS
jgi:putative SOS response-associated peptidase YedK